MTNRRLRRWCRSISAGSPADAPARKRARDEFQSSEFCNRLARAAQACVRRSTSVSGVQRRILLLRNLEVGRADRHHLDCGSGWRRHEDGSRYAMVRRKRQALDELFIRHH